MNTYPYFEINPFIRQFPYLFPNSSIIRLENEDLEIQTRIDSIRSDIKYIQWMSREKKSLFNCK